MKCKLCRTDLWSHLEWVKTSKSTKILLCDKCSKEWYQELEKLWQRFSEGLEIYERN